MKYFLKASWQKDYQEVTRDEYIRAERSAGFRPKYGDGIATAGFSAGSVSGKVDYTAEDTERGSECTTQK